MFLVVSIFRWPIWVVTCMSVAPEAIRSDAHTCLSLWGVYLTMPSG